MLLRSLGSGVSGLKGFQTDLDVIGNNIANVGTVGFKGSRVNFSDAFSQQLQGASANENPVQVGLGAQTASVQTIAGSAIETTTDSPSDLYINGDGYFQVTDGSNIYYTRAGDFTINSAGDLVSPAGLTLCDKTGTATTPGKAIGPLSGYDSYTIDNSGNVVGVKGSATTNLGTVGVYTFANPTGLTKMGGSLYQSNSASGDPTSVTLGTDTKIIQGALEESNVDLTDEMTNLITAQRAYQANAQTITTADDILQTLIQLKRS
ncbi:MAG: flagellar hook-basal body complex protein [Sporolactobacillus sp.]